MAPEAESTAHRFFQSTVAAYAIQLVRLLVNFGAKLVLARLILPQGHGLYELALRIVTVAAACRDLGLPYHLMRDERRPYGTVFVSTTSLGLVISIALFFLAPIFSGLSPELPLVLQVYAGWIFLDALSVVPKAFFERELKIGRLIIPEVARTIVLAGVSVAFAWYGWGVWSFIAGDLVAAVVLAAFLWWRAWGRMPFAVDLRSLPDLVHKSFYLFLIWLVLHLVTYIDVYVVDVFTDVSTVGLYARAYMIAFLVSTIVFPRALFPTLVEYLDNREQFLMTFRLGTVQLLGVQTLGSYFLLFNADRVVGILLGHGWGGAVPILAMLAFVPFIDQFAILSGELLKARHEDRLWLIAELVNLASLVGVGIVLTRHMGAVGMALANFFVLGNLVIAWRVFRIFGREVRDLLRDLALILLVPLVPFGLAAYIWPADSWDRFAASAGAAAISAAVLAALYFKPVRRYLHRH